MVDGALNTDFSLFHRDDIAQVVSLIKAGEQARALSYIDEILPAMEASSLEEECLQALRCFVGQEFQQASMHFKQIIDRDPAQTEVHLYLAKCFVALKLVQPALQQLHVYLQHHPTDAAAWFLRGMIAERSQQNAKMAFASYVNAIEHDRTNITYWQGLAALIKKITVLGPVPRVKAFVIEALHNRRVNPRHLSGIITKMLQANESFQEIEGFVSSGEIEDKVREGDVTRLMQDELLMTCLSHIMLALPRIEQMLTAVRRAYLQAVHDDAVPTNADTINSVSTLALYSLYTEFVFFVSEDEKAWLEEVRQRLANEQDSQKRKLLFATIGAYELLASLPEMQSVIDGMDIAGDETVLRHMVEMHVKERLKEKAYYDKVESFSDITDDVSLAVQQQYEENPYPRWTAMGEIRPTPFNLLIRRMMPMLKEEELPDIQASAEVPIEVLVAGTGTGRHAYICAREYANSQVFGVDLSRASLAYGQMKLDEYGIDNVTLRHGDLLDLPTLNRQFDVVESAGVLHHMHEPMDGWKAITQCLKPGGWMNIALYSYLARDSVRQAREAIQQNGYQATPDGIRQFRHDVMNNPAHELHYVSTRWRDFFTLSECRDLLFHVQEHQFTIPKLKEAVDELGLEFMGFYFNSGVQAVANLEPKITDWRSFEQWQAVEEANPSLFMEMYSFWLRKPV